MINIGGDTAFRVGVPGSPLTITHTDGFPVTPAKTDAVLLGMGERVDAVITMPRTAVPLVGIAEGKNGVTQVVLQPGPASALNVQAAATALMTRPASLVNALTAADAVRIPARQPNVVHNLTLEVDFDADSPFCDGSRPQVVLTGLHQRLGGHPRPHIRRATDVGLIRSFDADAGSAWVDVLRIPVQVGRTRSHNMTIRSRGGASAGSRTTGGRWIPHDADGAAVGS